MAWWVPTLTHSLFKNREGIIFSKDHFIHSPRQDPNTHGTVQVNISGKLIQLVHQMIARRQCEVECMWLDTIISRANHAKENVVFFFLTDTYTCNKPGFFSHLTDNWKLSRHISLTMPYLYSSYFHHCWLSFFHFRVRSIEGRVKVRSCICHDEL